MDLPDGRAHGIRQIEMGSGESAGVMRQADIVIVVLAVLAGTATLVGAMSGDRWTDERLVRFETGAQALAPTDLADVGRSGHTFTWELPANASSAAVLVNLYFEGQAVQGGSATVTLRFTGPDGEVQAPITSTWAIPQGATSAETQVNGTAAWIEVPRTQRDTTSSAHGVAWDAPLQLQVVVQPPSDLPLATYGFTAGVTGQVTTYHAT